MRLREKFEIGERSRDLLAADELGKQVELLRAHPQHLGDRLRLVLRERAGMGFLAHVLTWLTLARPTARAWPCDRRVAVEVRVGENSPSLWPTISSVTITGMCLWPL